MMDENYTNIFAAIRKLYFVAFFRLRKNKKNSSGQKFTSDFKTIYCRKWK